MIKTSDISMRYFSLLLLTVLFIGCSSETSENLSERVDQLIAEDNYTEAIELVNNADETDNDLAQLKEKAHLNYGMFLEYRAPEDQSMRERMTSALEQYIQVLNLNPQNQKARDEVNKIMGIYSTMPDKSPGENILENLRELGFDY